jgi:hypothetical protein
VQPGNNNPAASASPASSSGQLPAVPEPVGTTITETPPQADDSGTSPTGRP